METLIIVLKVCGYFLLLKLAFQISHGFCFIVLKKPFIWIGLLALVAGANMTLAHYFRWDPRVVSAATILAVAFNAKLKNPPVILTGATTWQEVGLPNAKRYTFYGLLVFSLVSIVLYVLFFGEMGRV